MNQSDNQSIVSEGVLKGVTAGATLEDLSVQNAEAVKGGPSRSATRNDSADDVVVDGKIITAENWL